MSRSTNSVLKRILSILAMAATVIAGIFYVQEFSKIDPLLNMRKQHFTAPDQLGVTLGDVRLVQYRGRDRVASATVDKVFIPSHRGQYNMEGVRDGMVVVEKGKTFHFEAPAAVWNANRRLLTANSGVHVWNKDLDLNSAVFRINEKDQTLYIPGQISGKFFGGRIQATNLLYRVKDDLAVVGPTHWDGNLALSLQDGDKPVQKRWEFDSAKGTIKIKGKIRTWEKGTASDGEIIVQADLIEHNESTDVVTATGRVRYFSPKANLTCDKAVVYRKEKRAVLTGAVDMLVKPKNSQTKATIVEIPPFRPVVPTEIAKGRPEAPVVQKTAQEKKLDDDVQDPKTLRDYPLAITAAKIEYWYARGSRRAIITGNPQARQELPEGRWRHLWAFQGFYDGEKETLKMDSRPGQADTRLQTSIGDDIVAEEVLVSTKEDDEDLEAKGAKGKVYGKSDEDGEVGPKPPDPIKPKTGGGGGLQGPIRRGAKPSLRAKRSSKLLQQAFELSHS